MLKKFQSKYELQNKEAAELLGCSVSAIQKWRSQEVSFSDALRKLLILLDTTFDGNRSALFQWMEADSEGNQTRAETMVRQTISEQTAEYQQLQAFIIEQHPEHFVRWRVSDTQIIYANHTFQQWLGLNPETLANTRWIDYVPEPCREQTLRLARCANLHPTTRHHSLYASGQLISVERTDITIRQNHRGPVEKISVFKPISMEPLVQKCESTHNPSPPPLLRPRKEMILYTDFDGILIAVSPSVTQWLGYEEADLIHQHFHTLFSPEAEERCDQIVCQAATGQTSQFFATFATLHHESIHVELDATVHLLNGHAILAWSAQDMTELHQCKLLLKKHITQKKALTHIIQNLCANTQEDLDDQITRILASVGNDSGAARACFFQFVENGTVIRATHHWQTHEPDNETQLPPDISTLAYAVWIKKFCDQKFIHIENIQETFELPEPQHEALCACKAKSLLAMPVFIDDTLSGFVEWVQSTETKPWLNSEIELAQAALNLLGLALKHHSRKGNPSRLPLHIEEALRSHSVGYFWYDTRKNILQASEFLVEMLGTDPSEKNHHSLQWLEQQTHPNDRVNSQAKINDFLSGLHPVAEYEQRIRQKNGNWLPVKIRWSASAYDASGRPIKIHGTCADISLQHEYQKAKVVSDRALAVQSEILANIGHELFTPLNGILGVSQLLEDDLPENERGEYLDAMKKSAARLTHIVQEMLDITSISTGKVRLCAEQTLLADICNDLHTFFQTVASAKGLQLSFSISHHVPQALLTDEIRLRQIVVNLIENAIKFTQTGYVRTRLYFHATGPDTGRLLWCVRDSGIGIHPEISQQIFDPFSQGNGGTTRPFEGAGLGLAISRSLAQIMGGSIAVFSNPAHGSLFVLDLPVQLLTRSETPMPLPLNTALQSTKKNLTV
jgi:PAS domain S-box-containing protein